MYLVFIIYAFCQRNSISKAFLYKSEKYSTLVSIYRFSIYQSMKFIIFEYYLVIMSKQLVKRKQTSSFTKLLALLLVFIRVYWLDNKSLPLYLLVIVWAY